MRRGPGRRERARKDINDLYTGIKIICLTGAYSCRIFAVQENRNV